MGKTVKAKNANLAAARQKKNDEFYTRFCDIESELFHYSECFKDKVVLCNCDDYQESQFVRYFRENFEKLGLKELISITYAGSSSVKARGGDGTHGWIARTCGADDCSFLDKMCGDGDFRSEECIAILKKADIVVTNPPFSLWREYITQLLKYDKDFLILGPLNGIGYKESFPSIKKRKMWLGYNDPAPKIFKVPDAESTTKNVVCEDGETFAKFGNIIWFTNLDVEKRHTPLLLDKEYEKSKYLFFDNYAALNVDRVKDIPKDYKGVMGVPITFLDKHCLEQFEIIDIAKPGDSLLKTKTYSKDEYPDDYSKLNRGGTVYENGELVCKYTRIFIKKR